jgi:hypothetical protein
MLQLKHPSRSPLAGLSGGRSLRQLGCANWRSLGQLSYPRAEISLISQKTEKRLAFFSPGRIPDWMSKDETMRMAAAVLRAEKDWRVPG